jgi:hypothetical protein
MSMDGPQLGLLFGPAATYHEAHSAEPQAPVLIERRRRRRPPVRRTRQSLADVLHHLADAVAPAPSSVRAPMSSGGTATR